MRKGIEIMWKGSTGLDTMTLWSSDVASMQNFIQAIVTNKQFAAIQVGKRFSYTLFTDSITMVGFQKPEGPFCCYVKRVKIASLLAQQYYSFYAHHEGA